MLDLYNSKMRQEAVKARIQKGPWVTLLIFVLVFFIAELAESVILAPVEIIFLFSYAADNGGLLLLGTDAINEIMSMPLVILVSLFVTVFQVIIPIIYCRFIEKRSLNSMGLFKNGFLKNYLIGFLIGIVMLSSSVFFCVLTGSGSILSGNMKILSIILFVLFFAGYLIQGLSEEIMLRGYLMTSLGNRIRPLPSILISSAVFSLLHVLNPNVTFLSLINIFLFGVFMGFFIIRTDNIWGAAAIHSAWNFFQGHIFGIQVSGMQSAVSTFKFIPDINLKIINGGEFGVEGGIAVTVVLVISIIAVCFIPSKKRVPN